HEFQPPRVEALKRTRFLTVVFALLITALGTFLFLLVVPVAERALWINAPLAGLAQHLAGPAWARGLIALALSCGAVLVVVPAAQTAFLDAEQMLHRWSIDGTLP